MAGANLREVDRKKGELGAGSRDGILAAAEVGTLNMKGTWLATLSACDTGTGEAISGEGVMGLRRAFIEAGALNLVTTLWPNQ